MIAFATLVVLIIKRK
ncbi:hypothetical protein [Sporomusa rhizae]